MLDALALTPNKATEDLKTIRPFTVLATCFNIMTKKSYRNDKECTARVSITDGVATDRRILPENVYRICSRLYKTSPKFSVISCLTTSCASRKTLCPTAPFASNDHSLSWSKGKTR